MKRILILLMSLIMTLSIAGCDDESVQPEKSEKVVIETEEHGQVEEEKETQKEENKAEKQTEEDEETKDEKIYTVGEEATFQNEDGKEMYSLRINGVNIADKFIERKDETFSADPERGVFAGKYEQAVEVNYTYTNLGIEDEKLSISPRELQVADIEGEIAESTIDLKKQPQELIPNTSSTVEGHHALMNKSDNVKIIFTDEIYNKTIIFEAPVGQEE